jgi:hypothetical protein
MLQRCLLKKVSLPNSNTMYLEYNKMKEHQAIEFAYDYKRVEGIIDPYDYMNMISTKIKAQPSLLKIAFTDIRLLYFILFHSWSHFVYRLNDPDKDKQVLARQQILNLTENGMSSTISAESISVILYILCFLLIFCIVVFLNRTLLVSWFKMIKSLRLTNYKLG